MGISNWEKVERQLTGLLDLKENWDGNGSAAPKACLISTTSKLLHEMKEYRSAPDDLYPLPDGSICLEWQKQTEEGVIVDRIIIDGIRKGERMVTFPDPKVPAQHYEITW